MISDEKEKDLLDDIQTWRKRVEKVELELLELQERNGQEDTDEEAGECRVCHGADPDCGVCTSEQIEEGRREQLAEDAREEPSKRLIGLAEHLASEHDLFNRASDLLSAVKTICDEPLDERAGKGPTRTEQFAKIDALLKDLPTLPGVPVDTTEWARKHLEALGWGAREDTERQDGLLDRLTLLGSVRVYSNPHDVGKWCVEIRNCFYWGDSSREALESALVGVRDTDQGDQRSLPAEEHGRRKPCSGCDGSGVDGQGASAMQCPECGGSGHA